MLCGIHVGLWSREGRWKRADTRSARVGGNVDSGEAGLARGIVQGGECKDGKKRKGKQ